MSSLYEQCSTIFLTDLRYLHACYVQHLSIFQDHPIGLLLKMEK